MTAQVTAPSSDQACARCGSGSADYSCVVAGLKYVKTTGLFAKRHHYDMTEIETPLCDSCAQGLRRILVAQRMVIAAGAMVTGGWLTYEVQRYLDPHWTFSFTWTQISDSLIPFAIVAVISGALLVALTYYVFQWPWLRATGVYAWLVESGRATSIAKIIRGPRRRTKA